MAGEMVVTMLGTLTGDPELRFMPSGAAVCNMRLASTPRKFDREKDDWVDGNALFLNVNCWRNLAENAAESFTKGMRVIVKGTLTQREYETKDGEKRTVYEIEAEDIGPSLMFATAKVTKVSTSKTPKTPPADEKKPAAKSAPAQSTPNGQEAQPVEATPQGDDNLWKF